MNTNSLKFWSISDQQVTISLSDIIDFLAANNFGTYYRDSKTDSDPIIIRVNQGIIKRFNKTGVINYCLDFITMSEESDYNKRRIRREFINKTKFLKTSDLYYLPQIQPDIVTDNQESAYFFFKNTAICISKEKGIESLKYDDLDGNIWDFQIIQKEVFLVPDEIYPHDPFKSAITCEFADFLWDLCDEGMEGYTSDRYNFLSSILGYLLHGYKNPSFSKAVVFFDFNPDKRLQGGTGKTLLARSLMELRKVRIIDGKLFSPLSSFAFSGIDESTRLIVFDDIRENFDFKNLYSIITSGLTVENKFQNSFHIPADNSPKIIITSNHPIVGLSNSFKRRVIEFDFSDYYIINQPPEKKFNHLLFNGWNNKEWNLFYNLMFNFVLNFLRNGIQLPRWDSVKRKKLIAGTSKCFEEYVTFKLEDKYDEKRKRFNKTEVYNDFINTYPDNTLDVSLNTFTKWLKLYAEIYNLRYIEKHSDATYYFKFD